ncbi:MAG: O-antigen ligase family protein [Actinomycetota bacterium]|nr:O-antigen ligase family protein [Actinomycetota bacterium]
MSAHVETAEAVTPDTAPRQARPLVDLLVAVVLGGALVVIAFLTAGGLNLAPDTCVEIALTVVGAGLACAVLLAGSTGRSWGGAALALFGALAALTYASIGWSVVPDVSWVEANRTLSYLAAFAGAMALARLAPDRWRVLVGALALAATVVCGYALLTKMFPGSLDPAETVGRLRAPFSYYNAIGLTAALGMVPCLWLGARPDGGRILRALSVPALAVLIVVLALSYSRGAVLAAVAGLACWFTLAPLRLRSALLLGSALAGGLAASGWALGKHAITADEVALPARTAGGHTFAFVVLAMVLVLAVAGAGLAIAMERVALDSRARRRVGATLLASLALVPVGGVAALAASSRGLTGEVSHLWKQATNPNGGVGNNPARLGELGSSRPSYWQDGLKIGEHALLAGVGARGYSTARTRYAPASSHPDAHSYLIETFADFGLIGVLLSLALPVAWLLAARRTLSPSGAAPPPSARAEQAGMIVLLGVAVAFGLHSAIDWTWFIPGVALPGLIAAGWLAGRGSLSEPVARPTAVSISLGRIAAVIALAALALSGAWVIWQPLRSADADGAALAAQARGDGAAALTNARTAVASDPVSALALARLSAAYLGVGDTRSAHRELVHATEVQPSNPETWRWLAEYDLAHGLLGGAFTALHQALILDPYSTLVDQDVARAEAALHRH